MHCHIFLFNQEQFYNHENNLIMMGNIEIIETTKKWRRFNWFQQSLVLFVGIFVILSSIYVIHRG